MIETIKKYIEDKNQIKLADAIIDKANIDISKKLKPSIHLDEIQIENFGSLKKFDFSFDKNITFFSGDRGMGKSWAMESWVYLLTGGSRSVKDVIGPYDVSVHGRLKFNDYTIEWNRGEKLAKLKFYKLDKDKNEFIITDKINELSEKLENHIGINPDLLINTIYYSPRLSFQFSRKMPFEIEELLINIAGLRVWLELEEKTKKFRKEEEIRLHEINGAIGSLSEYQFTEDELKKIITKTKGEITDIDNEIKAIKMPNIIELNKEYNILRKLVEQKFEIEEYRKNISKYEATKNNIEKELSLLGDPEKTIKAFMNEIDVLKNKLEQTVNDGSQIKSRIDESSNINKLSECPILKIDCAELKKAKPDLEKSINKLNQEREKLLKQYSIIKAEIDNKNRELDNAQKVKQQYNQLDSKLQSINDFIMDIKEKIKKIDTKKFQNDLKEYPNVDDKLKEILKQLESINREIKKCQEEKDKLNDNRVQLLSDLKNYEQKFQEYKRMNEFISEKERLEQRQGNYEILIEKFGKKGIPKSECQVILKKLNKYFEMIINQISNNTISASINEKFEMKIKCPNIEKELTPKVVSLGEEEIINLAFVLALGLLVFGGTMPYCFIDDAFAFQNDKTAKEIITGLIKMQKDDYIKQLYICSNKFCDLNLNKLADKVLVFEGGKFNVL